MLWRLALDALQPPMLPIRTEIGPAHGTLDVEGTDATRHLGRSQRPKGR
jgi:hypothetical protein